MPIQLAACRESIALHAARVSKTIAGETKDSAARDARVLPMKIHDNMRFMKN